MEVLPDEYILYLRYSWRRLGEELGFSRLIRLSRGPLKEMARPSLP